MKIEPRKKTDRGGYLTMPLKRNVPLPHKGWTLTKCPVCGCECWDRPLPEGYTEDMFDGKACTKCALKGDRSSMAMELKVRWEDRSLDNCKDEVGAIKSSIGQHVKDMKDVEKLRIIFGFIKCVELLN